VMVKKTGLGQGVGLLFGNSEEKYFECSIDAIIPNKFQPRTYYFLGIVKKNTSSAVSML